MEEETGIDPYQAPNSSLLEEPLDFDPQTEELPLASRGVRLGAAILDGLLVLAAMIPGFIMLGLDTESWAAYVLMGIGWLGIGSYQWYLIATRGQSLAKGWLKIKIVKTDGRDVGFWDGVVLRVWIISIVANIPYLGGVVGLVDALMIFGEAKRCLHDHLAGTVVIEVFPG